MAESAGPSSETTLDHVMRIDTSALLASISNIETKLTDHHRQDKLPMWANKMVSRIGLLEEQNEKTYNKLHSQAALGGAPALSATASKPSVSLQDLASDERITQKFKTELDLQISNVKLALESKVSAAALELDRLHKLLQIRPTQSELQGIVVSVHELNKKVQESVRDVSTNVVKVVQEKVSEQMMTLMSQLQTAETMNENNYKLVNNKVDGFTSEISVIRNDVQQKFDSSEANMVRLREDIKIADKGIFNLRTKIDKDAKGIIEELDEVRMSQQLGQDLVGDYRASVANQLKSMNNLAIKSDQSVTALVEQITANELYIKEMFLQTKDSVAEFKALYEFDMAKIRNDLKETSDLNAAALLKQEDMEKYITQLRDRNVLRVIAENEEKFHKQHTQVQDIEEKVKQTNIRTGKLAKSVQGLDDLVKGIPDAINEQVVRIDATVADNERLTATVKELVESLKSAQEKFDKISALREEVAASVDLTAAADKTLKQVQSGFVQLSEVSTEQNKRIETIISTITLTQEQAHKRVEDVRLVVTDLLAEKQGEIEASVQNMRDKLDMLSSTGENNSSVGGDATGTKAVSRKAAAYAGAVPAGGRGGGGLATVTGSSEVMSSAAAEGRAVTVSQVDFISDLCINFEEIAVKKSHVMDIPPTMCEHITATAQSLTALIASSTDADMVSKVLRSAPEEVEYDEELVARMRQEKLSDFIADVVRRLTDVNGAPGLVRFEARERFLKNLRRALQMCMSKHDQVLIVGSSKLGRIKVPSCIACNRPLLEKVPHDAIPRHDDNFSKSFVPYFGHGAAAEDSFLPSPSGNAGKKAKAAANNSIKLLVPRAMGIDDSRIVTKT